MAKEKKAKKDRKGFWKEFKEFISRGNVLDLAVGIIIGGAFTAIVTALCENILKPIINWLLALIIGSDSLDGIFTFLKKATDETTGAIDLANSIYIDWGALINAIINFLLIALVLFIIIKVINTVRNKAMKAKEELAAKRAKGEKEEEAAPETAEAAEEAANTEAVAEEAPVEEVPAPAPAPTTDELLAEIRDLLKAQSEKAKAQPKKTQTTTAKTS